ncbi:hypothetical protein PtA15_12A423 [Puccinia triticina]|uniref:Uncharacterized protein n=1 Tax=Puccinia triticina TaxID=208348 RepID=A0ABY7CYN5_9BASI|nr:uncharacterized protein PtA15_12A423 [Puccinia triticina]WAQ90434.1 hypothetical protein PtA15_12A423 [Puccinia triticina]
MLDTGNDQQNISVVTGYSIPCATLNSIKQLACWIASAFRFNSALLGLKRFAKHFNNPLMHVWFGGLLLTDTPTNTRFSINYSLDLECGWNKCVNILIMAKLRELDATDSLDDDDSSSDIS